MRYATVCSGIEAPSVAWAPLGWQAAWFSEIEPFPCSVLAHHHPDVPNLGDMTRIHETETFRGTALDLLAGGTPCQAFSVAGLRGGLADPRGNLALVFLGLVDRARPRWLAWENVPGVLSSGDGRDLGAFLGALGELGYGWAYRVLDAQYFGVAQRRRRVFVVGHAGGAWQRAAAVLLERHGLSGDPAPSRVAREDVAGTVTRSFGERGQPAPDDSGLLVAHALRAKHNLAHREDADTLIPALASCLTARYGRGPDSDATTTLLTYGFRHRTSQADNGLPLDDQAPTLRRADHTGQAVGSPAGVRRLTPRECERLQGFPDDYTLIPHRGKPAADGPRYKALGNSMAVPVMAWIGRRIAAVDQLPG